MSDMVEKGTLGKSALIAVLISALIFIICPAFIVSSNLADINSIPLAASAKVSLISFAVSFLGFFALLQIKFMRPVFFGLLIFVALAALVLPVTSSAALIDPSEQPVNAVNLILCLFIAIAIGTSAIKFDVVQKLGLTMISFISILTLVSSFFSISKVASPSEEIQNTFSTLSSHRNIIVMSFDGVPGEMITRILNDDEAFKSELKDFSYFPNTHSQSPSTSASLLGTLYGVHDYKSMSDTLEGLRNEIIKKPAYKNSYVNKIDDFEHLYTKVPGHKRSFPTLINTDQHSNVFLIQNSFSRIFTRYFFKTGIPAIIEKLSFRHINDSQLGSELDHKGSKWDFKNVKRIVEYDAFVSSLVTQENSRLAVRYYHNTFSHFPVDFDEDCVHRSVDADWFKSNQTELALQNQTKCVAKKMIDLVERLKEIGAYENATIVFQSDHGEPFYYFNDYPNNLRINDHIRFGYNRYRPFLMLKKPLSNQGEIVFDDRFVLLNDLAKTLCKASKVKEINCGAHRGINLLSDDEGLDHPYYLYILKNKKSTFEYDTHISIKIPNRKIDVIEFLKQHPKVHVSEP